MKIIRIVITAFEVGEGDNKDRNREITKEILRYSYENHVDDFLIDEVENIFNTIIEM